MSFYSFIKNIFTFFVVVTVFGKRAQSYKNNNSEIINILNDLPIKNDLNSFLKSLERTLNFCLKFENELDSNFAFGLFLVNVNLKRITEERLGKIPKTSQNLIHSVINKTNKMMKFFCNMTKEDKDFSMRAIITKEGISIFSDESSWIKQVQNYSTDLLKYTKHLRIEELKEKYSEWAVYKDNVDHVDDWIPNPFLSDLCMVSLASSSFKDVHSEQPKCTLFEFCYKMLLNGTGFGYAHTHRLLFLMSSHFGRGCRIFTPQKDKELMQQFCLDAYNEAEYIAKNNYQLVDLLAEQVALCTLNGHAQFLRRVWLANLSKFQTPYGCYGVEMYNNSTANIKDIRFSSRRWEILKSPQESMLGGLCNGHVTAVIVATVSAAARFVIETHY